MSTLAENLLERPFRPIHALGIGAILGLNASVFYSVQQSLDRTPVTFPEAVYLRGLPLLVASAYAVPIAALANRFRLNGGLRAAAPRVAMHVVFAVVYICTFEATLNVVAFALGRIDDVVRGTIWSIVHWGNGQLTLYFSIVGAAQAVIYYREARERERAQARLETSLAEARLQALRSQLNPHFLFNTLNAVSVLAERGETERVVLMIERLSELLRASLDGGSAQLVPLADELALIDGYLDIQRIRFGERLTVRTSVDPAARDGVVPVLVTQPIVENAIHHGVSRNPGPGSVEMSVRREGAHLVIGIGDSGPGFDAQGSGGAGIGLANTRQRLEQLYGKDASVSCANGPSGGGLVTLRFPYRPALAAAS